MKANDVKKTNFMGIEIVNETKDDLVKILINRVMKRDNISLMSINLTAISHFTLEMFSYLDKFDYVTADGMGVVKFSKLIGNKLIEDGYIPAICNKLLHEANKLHLRVFLLGATEEINNEAVARVLEKYPGLGACAGRNGYFHFDELNVILSEVREFNPHIILIGISSPNKERIINKIKQMDFHSINIACGGYLDILGGKVKDAPQIVRKLAIHWLYRFIQEPKRLYRPMLISGLKFLFFICPIYLYHKVFKGRNLTLKEILDIIGNNSMI
ncbi:MAG: WecB/TagA/CpsF family glycosyltransferase [Proteobacteria bacterium]|nr:WecB/TagA/CpsF family glycosyltransferase [Pseudomonadota bacterium]